MDQKEVYMLTFMHTIKRRVVKSVGGLSNALGDQRTKYLCCRLIGIYLVMVGNSSGVNVVLAAALVHSTTTVLLQMVHHQELRVAHVR